MKVTDVTDRVHGPNLGNVWGRDPSARTARFFLGWLGRFGQPSALFARRVGVDSCSIPHCSTHQILGPNATSLRVACDLPRQTLSDCRTSQCRGWMVAQVSEPLLRVGGFSPVGGVCMWCVYVTCVCECVYVSKFQSLFVFVFVFMFVFVFVFVYIK